MEINIVAAGMLTSVGYNVNSTSAALRAAITNIDEIPYTDKQGNPLRGSIVKLPQWYEGYQKLVDLVAPAIYECLLNVPQSLHHNIPLLIGLPLIETHRYLEVDGINLLTDIEIKLGLPHNPKSRLFHFGQVSGAKALKHTYELLTQDAELPYCIVAGVDSYLTQSVISHYLDEWRLITKKNTNGFFPGEAGGALLISLTDDKGNGLYITGLGEGKEPAPIKSGKVFKAQGMTDAIRQAISMATIPLNEVTTSFSDLNGEHYKFEEINLATGRFNKLGAGDNTVELDIQHPIEYIGEVGAAIIPCLLGYIWTLSKKGKLSNQYILISAGNDNEDRVALIVRCC